ncbi:MAG: SDR family NAD(P)-dependent oxidoreductase, partial [Actinobacteria bacterium]|nr:SDR family NAD(P)-dependent oxidoreductase [Actinomycetota bacterium]
MKQTGGGRWTAADVPDQQGRIAVITGGTGGLGLETAKVLAARGASVVIAGRDPAKLAATEAELSRAYPDASVQTAQLDLASLESVRAAAADLASRLSEVHLLINNAGLMMPPYGLTKDGYELQFG